jgi:hypothetical protein
MLCNQANSTELATIYLLKRVPFKRLFGSKLVAMKTKIISGELSGATNTFFFDFEL